MTVIDDASRAGSIAILTWPEHADRAVECARTGQPRLLLVASDAEPPADWDDLTDWVRLPVDAQDLCARVAALRRRALMLDVSEVSR
jgi:hypothetical protein